MPTGAMKIRGGQLSISDPQRTNDEPETTNGSELSILLLVCCNNLVDYRPQEGASTNDRRQKQECDWNEKVKREA